VEPEGVADATVEILDGEWSSPPDLPPLWDGHAGERIADIISVWAAQSAALASSRERTAKEPVA
jgi:hypothetical protein